MIWSPMVVTSVKRAAGPQLSLRPVPSCIPQAQRGVLAVQSR